MHQTSSTINVLNVNTIKQIVDMLTKTLHGDCFAKFHKLLGVVVLPINGYVTSIQEHCMFMHC
jgi:hypothetical protein